MKNWTNATLKSIANQLNISISTVSRALTGQSEKYRISKKTTQLILDTAKKLDYEPNQLARGLRLKKTNTIGIIVPDITNPFFSQIIRWIENSARENGISILISDSNDETELEKLSVDIFASRKIDGLIISPVGEESSHLIKARNKNIPIVLIDRNFKGLNLPFVGSDNYNGTKEAVEYLIANGHRRIGFLQGLTDSSVNQDRIKGYVQALKENGFAFEPDLVVGNNFGEESGYMGSKLLLNTSKNITAVFAASNLIALGAIRAIREEKLKIPEDISIISFDDQTYAEFIATPLTTVAQQSRVIGQIAYKTLGDMIYLKEDKKDTQIQLSTRLIIRDSVRKIN